MTDMSGNPHYKILADEAMLPEHGIVHAILTVAFELRTQNILAAQATPEWLNEARVRMGHETFPPEPDTPLPNPDKSTSTIVTEVLERNLEVFPSDLGHRICGALDREGRLSA
jgi:hypothetical protein